MLSAVAVIILSLTNEPGFGAILREFQLEGSSVYIILLFSFFCLWELSTVFLPYLTVKYLREILFSQDFKELFTQHSHSRLISLHNRIVLFNLFGSLISSGIYSVLIGIVPGISFALICSGPLFVTVSMAILNLQLILEANRKFLRMLKVQNWWENDDLESPTWSNPPRETDSDQFFFSSSYLITRPLLPLSQPSTVEPSSSSTSVAPLSSSVPSLPLLTQYYSLLRHYKLCSINRGMVMGLYLLYMILILLIMIGFSYQFRETLTGLSGIIIITDLMFLELVVSLAHVNEVGYDISTEGIGIYALRIFQTVPRGSDSRPSSCLSSEDRISLQINERIATTRDSSDWRASEALELLSCSKNIPMEIKVLSGLVIRYRLAFVVMWGLAMAIIPKILLS
jgi:hypothetical protein